ncbi:MAG: 16S rRNA (adenine(1518)-N(6)/adenine(1519)-N(6))-dimethyltransferase RsmA [Pseudomonadota bacterium]
MNTHKPRKRFGQHFLSDTSVVDRMLRAIAPKPGEHMVEIGPGQRALTEGLEPRTDQLTLIELDRDLVLELQQVYRENKQVRIVSGDALNQDYGALGGPLRLVGNLPYNISTPLLFHLLQHIDVVIDMHFMLQKEVVDRIVARAGDKAYGRLSVMLGCAFDAEHLFDVGPEAFDPPPKVRSAIVRLTPLPESGRLGLDSNFEPVVKRAFSMRRKTLRNALRDFVDAEQMMNIGIDPGRRPETLSIAEFDALSRLRS